MKENGDRMSKNMDSLLDTVESELLTPNQVSLSFRIRDRFVWSSDY